MNGRVKVEPQKAPMQRAPKQSSVRELASIDRPLMPLHDIRTLSRPMPSNGAPHQIRAVLNLQRTLGNRATGQLLQRLAAGPVQPKLTVGKPDDAYEREADAAADRVASGKPVDWLSRLPAGGLHRQTAIEDEEAVQTQRAIDEEEPVHMQPAEEEQELQAAPVRRQEREGEETVQASGAKPMVQRMCPACEEEVQRQVDDEEEPVQTKAGVGRPRLDTAAAERAMARSGSGQPLGGEMLARMEGSFGFDFSGVRVHADPAAQESSRAINARAFTRGADMYLGQGESATNTRLMAHELMHVVQQTGAYPVGGGPVRRTIGDGHDLSAPRFSGNVILEAVFDDERLIQKGARGRHVRLIQESLVAMGYALPNSVSGGTPGRLDGDFGNETEAAIIRFQTDAGATDIDGIVGPETMGLLDTHDVSTPTARPPATTGPVAAPLGAGGCDPRFAGVTFVLANQTASSVANSADIRIARVGGRDFLSMRGRTPISYNPRVSITAPSNADAANFRVGFVQNLLTSRRVAQYSSGGQVSTVVPTLPIKDGSPNDYNPIFVTNLHTAVVEDFASTGQTIQLNWPDVPADGKFINLLDNASCATSGLPAQTLIMMHMLDTFRIWVVAQHRRSGCVRSMHHVDWHLNWLASVTSTGATPSVTALINMNLVTEANGNGSPRFIQGGQVPGQIAIEQCV